MVPGGLLRITIPPPFSPLSHSTQMSSLHSIPLWSSCPQTLQEHLLRLAHPLFSQPFYTNAVTSLWMYVVIS